MLANQQIRSFSYRSYVRFLRFSPPSAYARLKWLKIMMYKLVLAVEKSASGQFRVIVFMCRNILLLLMLNQSCYAILACCGLNPPLLNT